MTTACIGLQWLKPGFEISDGGIHARIESVDSETSDLRVHITMVGWEQAQRHVVAGKTYTFEHRSSSAGLSRWALADDQHECAEYEPQLSGWRYGADLLLYVEAMNDPEDPLIAFDLDS